MPAPGSAADVLADLARVDAETRSLVATVATLDDAGMQVPSRCPGWTRGHVLSHLARNADSLVRLVEWATTGRPTPQYPSMTARDAEIQTGSGRTAAALLQDLALASSRFQEVAPALIGPLPSPVVATLGGPIAARELPSRRLEEVILHHDDLGAGWSVGSADRQSVVDSVTRAVARLESARPAPNLRLVAEDGGEQWHSGDGSTRVAGSAAALLAWLARGRTDGVVSADTGLPELPAWG